MGLGKRSKSLYKAQRTDNLYLAAFCLPAVVLLFLFSYLPMGGLILAFKDFRYDMGLFGSPWAGLKNFWIFNSQDAFRIIRNTVGYGLMFLAVGCVSAVLLSLLLFDVKSKKALKFYQTAYTIPRFMSWVIVSYITYIFLSPGSGVISGFITAMGGKGVNVFAKPELWPLILPIVYIWKSVGLDSIIYYAALMGTDAEIYEAAKVDGAGRLKQALYISLPSLKPTITILLILGLGNVLRGDFGLFYSIPRDVGLLYPTTDVIDTYVFRGLRNGNIGATAAVRFVQSVVGMIAVLGANAIVRKISPDNALY